MRNGVAVAVTVLLVLAGATAPVAANDAPNADFDYSPTNPVVDDEIMLDASGSADDGSIVSYEWDLNGDGDYGDWDDDYGVTTQVSFDSAGTYSIGLRVEDNDGVTNTERTTITVTNEKPEAEFSFFPTDPTPDETVTLDAGDASDDDGHITSYQWDLNGDGDYNDWDDGSGQTETIEFETAGTYTVGLKVFDNGEKIDTIRKNIEVSNDAPTAEFDVNPSTPAPDTQVTLDASDSSDDDGTIVSYEWDLNGDGDYNDWDDGSGQTETVEFDTGGEYTVGLRVTDNGERQDESRTTISVENDAPEPAFSVNPSSPTPDVQVTLDASDTEDDGNIISYKWDLNGDGDYNDWDDGSGQTETVEFDTAGTNTIGLRVTDNGGKSATISETVEVVNAPPNPDFEASLTDNGLTVELDASNAADPDENGRITNYQWDLDGDGTYGSWNDGSGQSTTVEFDSAGRYEIGLRVTDNGGATETLVKEVAVTQEPTAVFSVDPLVAATGQPATFDASESLDPDGDIEEYRWSFPDGTVKRGEKVTYQFDRDGNHRVSLTVVDSYGATATFEDDIQSKAPPEFDVSWMPETPRNDIDVVFSGNSSAAVNEYKWDFDADGDFDRTGEKVTYSFEETGRHTIRVRAVAASGVASTRTEVVTVQKSADFTLTSNRQTIEPGEETIVTFVASNLVRDKVLVARLELDFPSEGAAISSVSGTGMTSSTATSFVTIEPGEEESIRVRVQYTNAGEFDIGGNAVYYFETEESGTEDRRQTSVDAATISVREESTEREESAEARVSESGSGQRSEASTPGFGVLASICALLLVSGLVAHRRL